MFHLDILDNPRTFGRGPSVRLKPVETDEINVRFDQYDPEPCVTVASSSDDLHVEQISEADDGIVVMLRSNTHRLHLVLPMSFQTFINQLEMAYDLDVIGRG
jgi:hypothetical protein